MYQNLPKKSINQALNRVLFLCFSANIAAKKSSQIIILEGAVSA